MRLRGGEPPPSEFIRADRSDHVEVTASRFYHRADPDRVSVRASIEGRVICDPATATTRHRVLSIREVLCDAGQFPA